MMGSFGGEGGELFVLVEVEDHLYKLKRTREIATSTSGRVSLMSSDIIWRRLISVQLARDLFLSKSTS